MIAIIDYGMGNLGSIFNMFKKTGFKSLITSDINEIKLADKIVLPGVGSFGKAMDILSHSGQKEILLDKALYDKVPFLGICLGMQLLTNYSEEGDVDGLGLIPAKTLKFRFERDSKLKVPHMGWNQVNISNPSKLTDNLPEEPRFYFVHSYYVKVDNQKNSILKTNYGIEFDSAIQKDNIFGAQFHPEKSHKYGMKLFENFARL